MPPILEFCWLAPTSLINNPQPFSKHPTVHPEAVVIASLVTTARRHDSDDSGVHVDQALQLRSVSHPVRLSFLLRHNIPSCKAHVDFVLALETTPGRLRGGRAVMMRDMVNNPIFLVGEVRSDYHLSPPQAVVVIVIVTVLVPLFLLA